MTLAQEDSTTYFERIKKAFHGYCEQIRLETHQKLDAVGDNKEAQKKILAEQKAKLNKAFGELKGIVDSHNRQMRAKKEGVMKQQEGEALQELENQISHL